jgi:glycine/D-amino acid oxidase-like deaminating enzyme
MSPDAVVIGGGVVGAACALALARAGCAVTLLEAEGLGGGATAAAMGHLVALDGSRAELELCLLGLARWRALAGELGPGLELETRGTLWVAEADAQLDGARERCRAYREAGVAAEFLDARALRDAEPCLRPGLAGALRVAEDAVLYPPAGARLLAQAAARAGARIVQGAGAAALEPDGVRLADGSRIVAGQVVLAAGMGSRDLLPALPLVRRKGHLAVTERRPGFLRHQVAELGYVASAHGRAADSVACNLQPRPNGQLLLGSSRQFGDESADLRPALLRRMLLRALDFVPGLDGLQVLRAWTGFRPTTPDHLPLIGPLAGRPGLVLACGHEGIGITTAPATAELVAARILGTEPPLDPAPYLPSRFPELAHA